MYVEVNGTRLFVDMEGPGLVPDGAILREKPTLVRGYAKERAG